MNREKEDLHELMKCYVLYVELIRELERIILNHEELVRFAQIVVMCDENCDY